MTKVIFHDIKHVVSKKCSLSMLSEGAWGKPVWKIIHTKATSKITEDKQRMKVLFTKCNCHLEKLWQREFFKLDMHVGCTKWSLLLIFFWHIMIVKSLESNKQWLHHMTEAEVNKSSKHFFCQMLLPPGIVVTEVVFQHFKSFQRIDNFRCFPTHEGKHFRESNTLRFARRR